MEPTLGNGKICYIEIPAVDIERSVAFYQEVFGWNIRTRGDGSICRVTTAQRFSWPRDKNAPLLKGKRCRADRNY